MIVMRELRGGVSLWVREARAGLEGGTYSMY